MSEVKEEIKSEVKSQNTEYSITLEQFKTYINKSGCEDALSANQDTKQAETGSVETVKTDDVTNDSQVENVELDLDDVSPQLEQVSPLTLNSSKCSEFSISSNGSFRDEMENIIICVGNEYAYNSYNDLQMYDFYKKGSYSAKRSGSYNEFVRMQDDTKFDKNDSRSRRAADRSINCKERNRSRDNIRTRYSPDKNRNSYSSNTYRRSRSWEKGRSRYTSNRSRRSRSWDRSRRNRESRSPPYRSRKRRRRSHSRSCSSSYSSSKRKLDKKGSSTKKRKLSSDSPTCTIGKLLDHVEFPDDWIINCRAAKLNSTPPLPKSPPPAQPPPPPPPPPATVENFTFIPQSSVVVNNLANANLSSHLWVNQVNQHFQNFYSCQNSLMPSVSINNLPLIPSLGNLPVHITATGEQILHDMDGRPIPIGPNGRLLPVDMSGRLYPHIAFLYSNQAVPIYMTEDGVLRLPNGEPVPHNVPNQLPVNIDGSIIPIGPDSRPLYMCPNIPRQNPFISLQVENPNIPGVQSTETSQDVQTNPSLPAVTKVNTNTVIKKRFGQIQLPPTVIQIETVSDSELKSRQSSPEVIEIETKTDVRKELEQIKPEVSAATNEAESKVGVRKPPTETTAKSLKKVPTVTCEVPKRKLYEDVDLIKLVEEFSERVSKIKVRAIYQKKIREKLKSHETRKSVAVSTADKISEPILKCDTNPEKESLCTAQSEKYLKTTPEQNSSGSKKDIELPDLEEYCEKKFTAAINEAISVIAEIDFRPPAFGRFLFSESSKNFTKQSSSTTSPLLRNNTLLPFLSPENFVSQPKKSKSCVNFRFLPQRDGKLFEATVPSRKLSFAVQCDFTSKKIQNLYNKVDRYRKELFRCKNENAELTDLYKSVQEECNKKTEELSKIMKKMEEKDKIIRVLSQSKKFWE